MTKTDVLEHFGGVTKTAVAIGRTKSAVSQWPENLPWEIQCVIQVVTKGKLKAVKGGNE